jgi:hypothetical protein
MLAGLLYSVAAVHFFSNENHLSRRFQGHDRAHTTVNLRNQRMKKTPRLKTERS